MTHYSGSVMAVYFVFERRMSTGSEAISLLMCLEATKVVCLSAFKGAVSQNSAKLGNYKMPVKLRET